jgi:putative membrane protein
MALRLKITSLAAALTVSAALLPASAQARHRPYSGLDAQWLKTSIEGDRFEIAGGQLALARGTSPIVKALGQRLIADHSKSLRDAIRTARRLRIHIPDSPSPVQHWELASVSSYPGAQFDHWYSLLEVEDHKLDIMESEDEVDEGSNPKIRRLAAEDLPVLETHLALSGKALAANP